MSNEVSTAAEFLTSVVDLSTDSTTVFAYPVILRGISVNVALSAHAVPITDGSITRFQVPSAASVGQWIECGDSRMATLVVDPDNAATGKITVVYKPDNAGQAGSGAGLPA